jgi:integrin beta 3
MSDRADAKAWVDAVRNYIDPALDAVHERIDRIPVARDGRDGRDGTDGKDGLGGNSGRDGLDGKDGADGKDGFGFDDLTVDYDGERTFVFRFAQGERTKEFPFQVPVMIFRGAFREQAYERGDTVTFGGSLWVCNSATGDKPDDGIEGWTKAIRRGRDGKNGKDGERGMAGPQGRAGRDLTQMAADGSKW